jgi:hypothetical protein
VVATLSNGVYDGTNRLEGKMSGAATGTFVAIKDDNNSSISLVREYRISPAVSPFRRLAYARIIPRSISLFASARKAYRMLDREWITSAKNLHPTKR